MFVLYSYLNVRVPAFNNYTVHRPDGTTKLSLVPNWELFAAGFVAAYLRCFFFAAPSLISHCVINAQILV
jgi:hypothetical protein